MSDTEKKQSAAKEKKQPKEKKSFIAKLGKIVLIVLIIIIVLAGVALFFLDPIVKTAFTKVGPEVTGTTMNLETFDSSLFAGEVTVLGLAVGNPEGYHSPDALAFNTLFIKINNESLLTDTIVIEEIVVDGLHVDYEIQSNLSFKSLFSGDFGNFASSESNLTRILENVDDFARRMSKEKSEEADIEEEEPAEAEAGEGKKVVVKHILVQNTIITFSSALLKTSLTIPMPDFEMTETEETSYAEVISEFFEALYSNVVVAVAEYLQENSLKLADSLSEGLNSLAEETGKQLEQAGESLKGLSDDLGQGLDNLTDSLKLDKLF